MLWGMLLAVAGGLLGYKSKFPGGAMIFSMLAVGIFNAFTGLVRFPDQFTVIGQALSGAFIGIGLNRDMLKSVRRLFGAAVLVAVCMQMAGIAIGFMVHISTGLPLTTSFLSSAPGGMADMTLISLEMGADAAKIAVLHSFRVFVVLPIVPPLFKLIDKYVRVRSKAILPAADSGDAQPAVKEAQAVSARPAGKALILKNLQTVLIAVASGIAGNLTGMPAGTIIFSMAAVAVCQISGNGNRVYLSKNVRIATQMLVGALVGQTVNSEEILSMGNLITVGLLMIGSYLATNILLGFLLHALCKLDLTTALFATAPVGVADMALIASDIGGNGPQVAILQVVRLSSVVIFYPQIISMLSGN